MEPDWLIDPTTQTAEQALAEAVVGELPGGGGSPVSVPVGKIIGSYAIAGMQAEQMVPLVATLSSKSMGNSQSRMPIGFLPPVLGAALPIVYWLARQLGIGSILGISGWMLDMFQFGRVFMYWEGEAIGSLPPPEAFTWYYGLNGNQQRKARLRMEAADKGGKFQRAPIPGAGNDSFRSKSFWERLNPWAGGDSFWQRINPFT